MLHPIYNWESFRQSFSLFLVRDYKLEQCMHSQIENVNCPFLMLPTSSAALYACSIHGSLSLWSTFIHTLLATV